MHFQAQKGHTPLQAQRDALLPTDSQSQALGVPCSSGLLTDSQSQALGVPCSSGAGVHIRPVSSRQTLVWAAHRSKRITTKAAHTHSTLGKQCLQPPSGLWRGFGRGGQAPPPPTCLLAQAAPASVRALHHPTQPTLPRSQGRPGSALVPPRLPCTTPHSPYSRSQGPPRLHVSEVQADAQLVHREHGDGHPQQEQVDLRERRVRAVDARSRELTLPAIVSQQGGAQPTWRSGMQAHRRDGMAWAGMRATTARKGAARVAG